MTTYDIISCPACEDRGFDTPDALCNTCYGTGEIEVLREPTTTLECWDRAVGLFYAWLAAIQSSPDDFKALRDACRDLGASHNGQPGIAVDPLHLEITMYRVAAGW